MTIGDKACGDNLKKLFGLEGTSSLGAESFSSESVTIEFGLPVDGKLKFTAEPIDKTSGSFFMRMKVK